MAHAGGRPTLYNAERCEEVIRLMREGYSVIEVAYVMEVDRSTIHEWVHKHPEFSAALKKGKEQSEGWWLIKGRENIDNKDFNSGLWYMNMKNRHGWRDKTESNNNISIEEITKKVKENLEDYDKSY